jgi:hypothetical protein
VTLRAGVRSSAVLAGTLVVLAGLFALATAVPPLRVDCPAGGLPEAACHETVEGALKRGLPGPHPLILAARVEPGPAGLDQYGHRATVVLDLLALPGSAEVRMYYDRGGHWGGEMDRSAGELLAWWAIPPLVPLTLAGLVLPLAWRTRRRA